MNEKQVTLNEFMIAFEKNNPLILISATAGSEGYICEETSRGIGA